MSTTVELVRANERYARLRAAVEKLAADFAQRAVVYEQHPEYDTDRYLDGYATGMRVAEKLTTALLAAVDS